jgi:hypothetical protein
MVCVGKTQMLDGKKILLRLPSREASSPHATSSSDQLLLSIDGNGGSGPCLLYQFHVSAMPTFVFQDIVLISVKPNHGIISRICEFLCKIHHAVAKPIKTMPISLRS